jgi:hypothetical protein
MTENTSTTYSNKLAILAELWLDYRTDTEFQDFVEYNDIGLPLAYVINNNIVSSTDIAEKFVDETFELLLAGLEVKDTGFESMEDLLSEAE